MTLLMQQHHKACLGRLRPEVRCRDTSFGGEADVCCADHHALLLSTVSQVVVKERVNALAPVDNHLVSTSPVLARGRSSLFPVPPAPILPLDTRQSGSREDRKRDVSGTASLNASKTSPLVHTVTLQRHLIHSRICL